MEKRRRGVEREKWERKTKKEGGKSLNSPKDICATLIYLAAINFRGR